MRHAAGQRRWLYGWIVVAVLVTVLPYVVAAVLAPQGQVYLGSLLNADDTGQFLAAMRQGAEGRWLYRNPFTAEETRPVLMYLLYVLAGRLAGWAGLDLVLAYHLLRICGAVLLLLTTAELAHLLLQDAEGERPWRVAFTLAAFSAGLGWLGVALPGGAGRSLVADLAMVEMTTFQSYYVVPHYAWGLTFELLTMLCFLRAAEQPVIQWHFWRWALAGGLACLAMGLAYPFALVVVYGVLGAFVLLALMARQERACAALWGAVTIVGMTTPLAAYYGRVFLFDPVWHATHVTASQIGTPGWLSVLFGYGLVLILAVVGGVWVLQRGRWQSGGLGFLLVWNVAHALLTRIPVSFQGRLLLGQHVALSLLAALGLEQVVARFRPHQARRIRDLIVILAVPSTMVIVLAGPFLAVTRGGPPFYLSEGELGALDWLAAHVTEGDVVLSSYAIGNVIPARAACRVFLGHQFSSYRMEEKHLQLARFFAVHTPEMERMELLGENGVTWVYYGPREQELGGFDPSGASYLEPAYSAAGVSVYAVAAGPDG